MYRSPITTSPFPGLGARGKLDAVEYHLGSHRYIDDAGLCRPEFHDQLGAGRDLGGNRGGRDGRLRPAGLDPPGRSAPARGSAACSPSCTGWACERSC